MFKVFSSQNTKHLVCTKMYKRPVPRKTGCPSHVTAAWPFKRDESANMWQYQFKPIKHWEGYINSQRIDGADEETLKALEKLHRREWPVAPAPKPKKTYNTSPVIVKMKYDGDAVKVSVVENKLSTLLRDYLSRGKIPPQKIWIEAWMRAGRPYKEILDGIIKQKSRRNDPCPLVDTEPVKPVTKKVLVPVKKLSF